MKTYHNAECAAWRGRKDNAPKVRPSCERCQQDYDSISSPCSHCGEMVTNGAFFKKTSPHFKLTCQPKRFKLPEQSWKRPLPYPMPPMPKYEGKFTVYSGVRDGFGFRDSRTSEWPTTLEELRAFWGVPAVGEYQEPTEDEKLLQLMEEQNRLLRAIVQNKGER